MSNIEQFSNDKIVGFLTNLKHELCSSKHSQLQQYTLLIDAVIEVINKHSYDNNPLSVDYIDTIITKPLWVVPVGDADWEPQWSLFENGSAAVKSKTNHKLIYFLYCKDYSSSWVAYSEEQYND